VKTRIVRIGNSQGIRIPKLLLAESGLEGEVEIEVRGGELVVRAAGAPRAGAAAGEVQEVEVSAGAAPRRPGRLKGRLAIRDDFDAPLPEGLAAAFRGEGVVLVTRDGKLHACDVMIVEG